MSALNPRQLVDVIRRAGFPERDVPTMAAIAMAESGGNPRAHNPNASTGDNSYGLFQVNMLGPMGPERRREFGIASDDELFDPVVNAKAAKRIYDSQGLGAWSVHRSGAYQRHLQAAQDATTGGGSSSFPASASTAVSTLSQPDPVGTPRRAGGFLQDFLDKMYGGLTPGQATASRGGPESSIPPPTAGPGASGGADDFFRTLAFGFVPKPSLGGSTQDLAAAAQGRTRMAGGPAFREEYGAIAGDFDPLSFGQEAMKSAMANLFDFTPKTRQPDRLLAPTAASPSSTSVTQGSGGRGRVIEYLTGDDSHPGYDPSHGGSNYHEHLAFGSKQERDLARQVLEKEGIVIGSMNDGKHAANSYHYSDQAFDVPAHQVPVGQEKALSSRVRNILQQAGFAFG